MLERRLAGTLRSALMVLLWVAPVLSWSAENQSDSDTSVAPLPEQVATETAPTVVPLAAENDESVYRPPVIAVEEKPLNESEYQQVKIADAFIDLRSGPGRGFPIYQSIERGEWVEILRRRTEWYQLRTRRGVVGWAAIAAMKETLDAVGEKFTVTEVTEDQFRARTFEAGFQFGEFQGVNAITAYGAWSFTENLATELSYQETLGNISDGQIINLSLTNTPFPEWRFSPFFVLGAGTIRTEPFGALVQTEDRKDTTAHVGVGLRTYITRSFVFRMDYKHYMVLTSRNENENVEEWKLGFSVFF